MIKLLVQKKPTIILISLIFFCSSVIDNSYGALPRDHPSLTEVSLQYEVRNSEGKLIAYFEPTLMYIIDLALVHENLDSKENKSIIVRDGMSFELIQYKESGILSAYAQYSSYDMTYQGKTALAMRHDGYLGEPGDLFNVVWTIVRPSR